MKSAMNRRAFVKTAGAGLGATRPPPAWSVERKPKIGCTCILWGTFSRIREAIAALGPAVEEIARLGFYSVVRLGRRHSSSVHGRDRFVHPISRLQEFNPIEGMRVRLQASGRPNREVVPHRETVAFESKIGYIEFLARGGMRSACL